MFCGHRPTTTTRTRLTTRPPTLTTRRCVPHRSSGRLLLEHPYSWVVYSSVSHCQYNLHAAQRGGSGPGHARQGHGCLERESPSRVHAPTQRQGRLCTFLGTGLTNLVRWDAQAIAATCHAPNPPPNCPDLISAYASAPRTYFALIRVTVVHARRVPTLTCLPVLRYQG